MLLSRGKSCLPRCEGYRKVFRQHPPSFYWSVQCQTKFFDPFSSFCRAIFFFCFDVFMRDVGTWCTFSLCRTCYVMTSYFRFDHFAVKCCMRFGTTLCFFFNRCPVVNRSIVYIFILPFSSYVFFNFALNALLCINSCISFILLVQVSPHSHPPLLHDLPWVCYRSNC